MTLIEVSLALVTRKVAVPDTPLMLAVMVEVPAVTPFARPAIPLAFMVATEVCDELHVTCEVRF